MNAAESKDLRKGVRVYWQAIRHYYRKELGCSHHRLA